MHELVAQDREVLADVGRWVADRLTHPPTATPQGEVHGRPDLPELTAEGVGTASAWASLRDAVLPSAFPTDHPRYLAFVGGAPTPTSVIADAALSAASVYGGSEMEAGAVVAAERAALEWLCRTVGLPAEGHGAFVSGGSLANLSALVAARHGRATPSGRPPGTIVAGASAHSSVGAAAAIMGCDVVIAGSPDAPLQAAELAELLDGLDPAEIVAVVASAGATNTGCVDELAPIADLCRHRGLWLHVDAAYGGAAMLAAGQRPFFAGIERADSVTLDPHKWLFTPFDCAAVLYREPARARAAHRQHAHYLDAVNGEEADNPADYAVHLTRRARGLPLWTSLLANGTEAYVDAVERCLAMTAYAAKQIESRPELELAVEPQLSVVLFRRRGWEPVDYATWSHQVRVTGLALVTPTTYDARAALRFCFVNPRTTEADVDLVLASLVESRS